MAWDDFPNGPEHWFWKVSGNGVVLHRRNGADICSFDMRGRSEPPLPEDRDLIAALPAMMHLCRGLAGGHIALLEASDRARAALALAKPERKGKDET